MEERLASGAAIEHLPPAGAATPTAGEPGEGLDDPRVLQILSTEHWSLLSARSLVYNEAFARAGMFLTFLSASLVALAFVANAMAFSHQFLVLAAILLFVDIAIGLATLGRMLDASVDDLRSLAGMNRIRNAYVQIAPAILPYLSTGIHDDSAGVLENYGDPKIRSGPAAFIHGLTTAAGMIMVIDSLLLATFIGVLALIGGADMTVTFVLAGAAFVVLFAVLSRYAYSVVAGFEATFRSRFPTPPGE